MKHWIVITPEVGVVIPVLDDGSGPMEYGCDVVEVEAESRRDAIALGVGLMLRERGPKWDEYTYCRQQRADRCSPYTGVTARELTDEDMPALIEAHRLGARGDEL